MYIGNFLLSLLFREMRNWQKLDTQKFYYSKSFVPYIFIRLKTRVQLIVVERRDQVMSILQYCVSFPDPRCPILAGLCQEQCHCQQLQPQIKKLDCIPLKPQSVVATTSIHLKNVLI